MGFPIKLVEDNSLKVMDDGFEESSSFVVPIAAVVMFLLLQKHVIRGFAGGIKR